MRHRLRFFHFAYDPFRKPVPIPDQVEDMLFGIMCMRNRALIAALIETQHWGREGAWRAA